MKFRRVEQEGCLCADPETRQAKSGDTVLNFSIADNVQKYNEETKEYETIKTNFFDVEYWAKDPQKALKQLGKGVPVIVFGRLKQDRWEKDGQARSRVVIVAERIVNANMKEIEPF